MNKVCTSIDYKKVLVTVCATGSCAKSYYHSVDDVCNNVNIIIVINQMKNCKMVLKLYKTKLQITLGCYGLALSDTGSLYNTQATRDGAIFTCWSNRLDGVSTSYLEQCKEYLLV